MAVKFEYSVNMQESFHVFLGLAIDKSEALMELFNKKNEPWSLTGKVGRIRNSDENGTSRLQGLG
jgi:hypothetical protein